MIPKSETLELIKESNKFIADETYKYVDNIKKAATDIYKKYKKKLEKIVALQQINKNTKAIEFKIDTEFTCDVTMNMYHEFTINAKITPKSGKQVEEDILIAQWHGTGMGLRDDIIKYIENQGNIDSTKPEVKDAQYYFQPNNMDIKFKNEYEKVIKKV